MQTKVPTQTDEIPRKLLYVVKAREKSSMGFETFLKNRGWDVISTCDLKTALAGLFAQPIHCVLVTVEHANAKCLRLPGIIAQTLKIPVIMFDEGLTSSGMSNLRATAHPYTLGAPLSGPAIERMINKIERDLARPLEASDERARQSGSTGAIADFVHLFEGDGQAPMKSEDSESTKASDSGYRPDQISSQKMPSRLSPRSLRRGSLKTMMSTGMTLQALPNLESTPPPKSFVKASTPPRLPEKSVLIRGVEHALAISAVQIVSDEARDVKTLDRCSRVSCFSVSSSLFSGLVVVAFGSEREVDREFTMNIKTFFADYLAKNGVQMAMQELPDFKMAEVSFEKWSLQHATFLRKTVHFDQEVAISFFPEKPEDSPLQLSAETHMAKIDIEEIRQDVHLEFDIYLHFPVNQKYIRYAAKGRNMFSEQRSRITAGGITHVHIRKECEHDVVRYRVQNFLNDKIRDYTNQLTA